MDILLGAMAFAVLMILMSTIATGIVEALLRILATRQQVLAKAVEHLAEDALGRFLKSDEVKARAAEVDKVVQEMTLNLIGDPASEGGMRSLPLLGRVARWWKRLDSGIETLTTYSFLQRLAKTEVGDRMAAAGRTELRAILTDLGRTYERYIAASNEMFRKRAHIVTCFVAILMAFALNIDAGRIFLFLANNPGVSEKIVANAENAIEDNRKQAAELEALLTGAVAEIEQSASEEDVEALKAQIAELKMRVGAASTEVETLAETYELPLGHEFYPFCGKDLFEVIGEHNGAVWNWEIEPCEDEPAGLSKRTPNLWLANVLLSAALISLGGPFWYRVFTSLSQLATVLRQFGGGGRREKIEPDASGQQPESAKAMATDDVLEVFEIARRLRPDGSAPPQVREA